MCERVAISSGTFGLGRDETVFQASFSSVGTSRVATAVSRHGVALGESPQGVDVRRLQFGRPALG